MLVRCIVHAWVAGILGVSLGLSCSSHAESITLANGEYAPYFSQHLPFHGVGSRIVKSAFAYSDIEVEFVFRPWERGLEESASGRWHGSVGWLKTPERLARFYYSDPIVHPLAIYFQRRDTPIAWLHAADLAGKKIGATGGFSYGEEFDRAEAEGLFTVVRCVDDSHCLRMLMNKRVDLAAVEYDVGLHALREKFSPEEAALLEPQSKPIFTLEWHLLLTRAIPGNAQRMERFNAGLKHLADSDQIEQYWAASRKQRYRSD